MPELITTKPGDKYRSLKWPALYEKLRARGYSKEAAARISNAQARKRRKVARFAGGPVGSHAGGTGTLPANLAARKASGWGARVGEAIAGNLYRGEGGRFSAGPGGGGSAAAADKPTTTTTTSRRREIAAARRARRDAAARARDARMAAEDTKRAEEDAYIAAGATGRDRQQRRREVATARRQRAAERRALASAEREAERAEREREDGGGADGGDQNAALAELIGQDEKPAKGGGGGGGGKKKPTEDEKRAAQLEKKRQTAARLAKRVGLSDGNLIELQRAADEGGVASPTLFDLGLVGEDGDATDQGRRALSALERGDVRGYRAAVQDAKARMGRDAARAERDRARADAQAQREQERTARDQERAARDEAAEVASLDRLLADLLAEAFAEQTRSRGPSAMDRQRLRRIRDGMTVMPARPGRGAQSRAEATPTVRRPRRGRVTAPGRGGSPVAGAVPTAPGRGLGTLTRKAVAFKHGSHNQASHGRRGGGARAAGAAYRQTRAGGGSVADARAAQRDVMASYRAQQRIANINKQLGGNVSPRQRASLEAERTRLQQDTIARSQRTPAAASAIGSASPTVQGRGAVPKGNDLATNAESRAYGQDPNRAYTMQHKIVDMADIQASNTANGGINPKYDPALQPRDRSRAASQAQIDQVARQLNPDAVIADFHRIDSGSPIVDSAGNVLSGNGRTLALQRAAELYPERYAAYKTRLKDEAARLGLDPKAVDGMKNPVLVRELRGADDPIGFAREANSSGTLRMSPLEQAKVDAAILSNRTVVRLNVAEGQGIDQALRSPANKAFVDDFLRTVPDNERANLLTKDGSLNQMGLYRAKAALYTKAFPGDAGSRMAESMLESLDPDVKTIQNGISGSLPAFSRATALIRSGERDAALDLSDDFARTIDVYARIKDNPSLTANTPANQLVAKYLGQSSMFDRELTPDQERLLVHIDKISRKPTAVRDMFTRYAELVEQQPPPGQASLFGGGGGLTRRQLLDAIIGNDSGIELTPDMFGSFGQQPGAFA